MTKEEQVLAAFKKSEKPLKAGQVAELTGIDKEEVSKIMKKLKADNKIESPKNCFWQAV